MLQDILKAAGANLTPHFIEVGEKVYRQGHSSGIVPESWDTLRRTKIFLKAPITTPTGSGYKSLNVTIRKTLGLYANVRPCVSYAPFIKVRCRKPQPCAPRLLHALAPSLSEQTHHPKMDVVIVRENEEDLYAGIEHRQTSQVFQCLKLITVPGCEKIVRYAFDYARKNGRKRVTCVVKDNIMKLTDGLFYRVRKGGGGRCRCSRAVGFSEVLAECGNVRCAAAAFLLAQVFEEIGKREYPDIARDRIIVDIGAAMLADQVTQYCRGVGFAGGKRPGLGKGRQGRMLADVDGG
jgi:isocitrate/isopropylmalate dehydrogenase